MLPELPQEGLVVLLVLAVVVTVVIAVTFTVVGTVLMKLLGAVGAFEFVALTGGAEEGDGGEQQGKAFHCRGI